MNTTELVRDFRRRIAEGPVFGPFSKSSDPAIIETLGHAGFDFIILDLEHGPNSIETLQGLIRAAQIAGMAPMVRVPSGDDEMIGKALDVGAAGVQVPKISCAENVRAAVEHAKFAPLGMRGVCRYVRAAGYSSMDKADYFREANETLLIIQIDGGVDRPPRCRGDQRGVRGMQRVFCRPAEALPEPHGPRHRGPARRVRRVPGTSRLQPAHRP